MENYRELLTKELINRKSRNGQYSLRAFASFLNMSPAQLSMLMNGKKKLTPLQASKIINKLNLSPNESLILLGDIEPNLAKLSRPDDAFYRLSEDEFKLISDSLHFAILSLAKLKSNKSDPVWISKRLNCDLFKVKQSLSLLVRLGFLRITGGRLVQSQKPLITTTDVPSSAMRLYHKENLEIAKEKIDTIPVEFREYTAITMAVNLKKIKKMINDFKQLISDELEDGSESEVYTLAIQLFPLTTMEEKK